MKNVFDEIAFVVRFVVQTGISEYDEIFRISQEVQLIVVVEAEIASLLHRPHVRLDYFVVVAIVQTGLESQLFVDPFVENLSRFCTDEQDERLQGCNGEDMYGTCVRVVCGFRIGSRLADKLLASLTAGRTRKDAVYSVR